jgi:hypothetical protein
MRFYYWTGEFAINNIPLSIIIPSTISERSFTMFRYALPLALPVSLAFLLSACGHEEAPQVTVRPAMVVQPEPSAQAMESFPGEVRARYEPDLAFRIGGKVSRRLVEEGQRVKADQPLAELDPQDVRLQLEATRAQVAAAEANLSLVRAERDRYKTLMDRQMVSRSQYDNSENHASIKSKPNSTFRPIRPVTPCCVRLRMAWWLNARLKSGKWWRRGKPYLPWRPMASAKC